ncbi:sialidase-like [Ruditapes philippinarum]|uniref:sialidase-like n=1 Tax=Ruditapes philippinarum TaxID=129788 RepID=UPI00295BAB13|nr:sialidase-like [Ruditapes philippinarum]
MLPAYQQLPPAILAAREDEALAHGRVLYGLIKPTKDMKQIESTAAMVNVIPKKRIYRMENPEEVDLFMAELMKRPLVLQPSAFIGRGLSVLRCTLYSNEERWVMLINQAHPKVHSRIKIGIETAKAKMNRGEPFTLEISFNAYLKRIYLDKLTKAVLDKRFTSIDFEDAEIVIRYPGDRAHRGIQWELQASNQIRFEFEDLLPSDIERRTVMNAQTECSSPALQVIMPDELLELLPGWDFEMIDPMSGVVSSDDEEDQQESGAVGGFEPPPPYESQPFLPQPADGKVVGRARRKANQAAEKVVVPVEMHAPVHNRQQTLYPPNAPTSSKSPSSSNDYERLNRQTGPPENPYAKKMVQNSDIPRSPGIAHRLESPYETMNSGGKYGQNLSPYGPSSPSSPGSPRSHGASPSPHSPRSPKSYGSPPSPLSPRTPRTPVTPQSHVAPRTPTSVHAQMQDHSVPRSPVTPRSAPRNDRYNTEYVSTRPSQQTYLTDDDDGGFSQHGPKSPQVNSRTDMYNDSQYNSRNYDPRDRYANQPSHHLGRGPTDRTDDVYRDGKSPSWQGQPQNSERSGPIPAPRGFHRHQGSGRSDTSASDSGFGENENGVDSSNHRTDRNGGYNNNMHVSSKTPYYNRAFEKESPEKDHNIVDDIMAKHKALAANLMKQQGQGQGVRHSGHRQDYYNDSNYNKELQKVRLNINDLEQSCAEPEVEFSRSRLRVNSQEEPMAESFI